MYGNGDGVPLDNTLAAEWMAKAADKGHLQAELTLAWMHANGVGVAQDEAQVRHWYARAAEQGSAQAQYMLATMYRFGQYGVDRDVAQAVPWYLKAADQSFAPAQFALGRLLMDGKYVERDDMAALQWLSLAHVNGSSKAEEVIEHLIERMPVEQVQAVREAMLRGGHGDDDVS
jgi:TPR repeat protein